MAGSTANRGLIAFSDLVFRYPRGGFRLHVPRLDVQAGEKVVIIGPSGSGKTTLLSLIAGILLPESGRVEVNGSRISRSDAGRRAFRIQNVGMIFQEFELLDHLTVRENILLPYFVHSTLMLLPEVEAHLGSLTSRAGISTLVDRKPRALSHGERQRVAICRALITRPTIVLADEPTGNLDPEITREVLSSIFQEVEEDAATLVMVTHDHSLLDRFDRVIDFDMFRERIQG
jgi:putative ABC transport system ATP-binding protein